MAVDYKSYDFKVHEFLIRLKQVLEKIETLPEGRIWLDQAEKLIERIRTRKFRVAVVGEFKRGKTSFINALLGKRILPADATPTTATINRITYGTSPSACLFYKDGRKQEVRIEELSDYVTKLTAKALDNAEQIKEAVVEYPSVFCQNYVDLIDTPGMNDDDQMNQVTVSRIEDVDLAIVAVSAAFPFSETECMFMIKLLESPEITQIIVVVTYIDQIRKREREKLIKFLRSRISENVLEKLRERYPEGDDIFEKYRDIFTNLKLFEVSSLDALEARETNDRELLRESGFDRLNEELPRLILSSQNNQAVSKGMEHIDTIVKDYLRILPGLPERLERSKTSLKRVREVFLREAASWPNGFLTGAQQRIHAKIDDSQEWKEGIRKRFVGCLSEIREADNEIIRTALNMQMASEYSWINREQRVALEAEIHKIFSREKEAGLAREKERLMAVLDIEKSCYPRTVIALEEMLQRLEKTEWKTEATPFGWITSPVPAGEDLVHSNIMAYVERASAQALTSFRNRYATKVDKFFEAVRLMVKRELNRVAEEMLREERQGLEKVDRVIEEVQRGAIERELKQIEAENAYLTEQFRMEIKARV